jgi:hypothetical protein
LRYLTAVGVIHFVIEGSDAVKTIGGSLMSAAETAILLYLQQNLKFIPAKLPCLDDVFQHFVPVEFSGTHAPMFQLR